MPAPMLEVAQTCEPNSQPYNYLRAPGTFSIPFIQGSTKEDQHPSIEKVGSYYISCEDVRHSGLPLDPDDARAANPRAPDNDAAVVSDMRSQLVENPGLFHIKNGGITIICAGFEVNGDNLVVEIIEGDGIINGGHTYYSIMSMIDGISDTAQVRIDFIQLDAQLPNEERKLFISNFAIARNKNRELSAKSTANYLGYYENWKNSLSENVRTSILWKEGEQGSQNLMDAESELIPLLWGMEFVEQNFHLKYNDRGATPMQFTKTMHQKWFDEVSDENEPLEYMLPLLETLLRLREYIGVEMHQEDMFGQNSIPLRNLTHAVPARAGPGSPPLSKTTFRRTNFANWLLTGTVKGNRNQLTKPSIFNGEDVPTIPSTVRDILLGNFRSVLWYKLDSDTGDILTGFTVDPFELWKTIKTKVMGALLNQFNGVCRQDPKVFVRDETIKFIDLLSWGGIEWDYGSHFPLIMARGGSLHLNSPSVEGQEPSFWAKNDPDDEDFIEILLREEPDTQPYYALEES